MIKAKMRNFAIALMSLMMVASFAIGVASFSNDKVAKAATTTYSVMAVNGDTTTWDFTTGPSSSVKVGDYLANGNDDNGLIFGDTKDNAQFKSEYLSVKVGEKVYIPVPAGYDGTFSIVTTSKSDGRWFAFVPANGVEDGRRCYSKPNATEQVDVKGQQSFDFTGNELTLIGSNYYVVLLTYGGEMKPDSFSLKVSPSVRKVSYDALSGTNAPEDDTIELTVTSLTVGAAPTAPEGKEFAGWKFGEALYQPNDTLDLTSVSGDVEFTAVYTTLISEIVDAENIIKVLPQDIAAIGLPETVEVVTVDGSKQMAVAWGTTSLVIDGTVTDPQTVNGTITVADGYKLAEGVENTVSVSVTILATAPEITAITAPETINVLALTESVELPTTVEATVNGQQVSLGVTWAGDYALNTVGEYTLTGTVEVGEYVLGEGLTVSQVINVYADEIVSVESVSQSVGVGATVNLPNTITVTVQDSLTMGTYEKEFEVSWNEGNAIDTSALGTQTISGALTLDASVANSANVPVVATINVINQTEITWVAYTDGSEYGVNWTTVYIEKVLGAKNGIIIKAENGSSSDSGHPQTAPMIKLNKGTAGAISITVPETATMISIEVDAAGFSTGKEGSIQITNGTATVGSADISATTTNTDDNSLTANAPTVATATYNGTTGGVYYIQASNDNNLYVTAIRVKAIVPELMELSYNANGGENAPASSEYEKNSNATVSSAVPTKAGYEFIGWNTQADGQGTSYVANDTIVMTESVELFAIYKALITSVATNSLNDFIIVKENLDNALSTQTITEIIGLPASVSAKLGDGSDVTLAIDWADAIASLETATYAVGTYTLEGVISNVIDTVEYNFDSSVDTIVSIKVMILAEKMTITEIAVSSVSVELGQTATLPTVAVATLSDTSSVELAVSFENANIDWTLVGTNEYVGEVTFDENTLELGQDVSAKLSVEVYNYEMTSINPVSDVNVFVGANVIPLPSKVVASYSDKDGEPATVELDVAWDTTSLVLDGSVTTAQQVTGTITFTDLYTKGALSETITANVLVKSYVAASVARSTNWADYAVSSAGSVRGFTLTGTVAPDTMNGLAGQKIKNGSMSFELTSPAKVTFAITYQKDLAVKLDGGAASGGLDLDVATYPVNQIHVLSFDLAAGTHSISSSSNSGSFNIGYVIIDDGGSEIFIASEEGKTLPALPVTKTVDGVEYKFYGWTTKEGTELLNVGASAVKDTCYYALYLNASAVNGAAIKVIGTDKSMRFTSYVNALNAQVILENLITNNVVTVSNDVKLAGATATPTVTKTAVGDKMTIYSVVAVAKMTNEYVSEFNVSVGSNAVIANTVTRTAKYVAEQAIADTQATADAEYKFLTDANVYSCYNTEERASISAYIVDDAEPEQPGTEPEQPGTEPEQPGTEPEQPGTEPEQPGTEPEQPGTEPEQPGTEPEQPVENLVTTVESVKNEMYISELTTVDAGTYYLGGAASNYIFKIEVTEGDQTYVLNASDLQAFEKLQADGETPSKLDGEEVVCGTDNYFSLICATNKTAVNASNKTFSDGFSGTQRINFGGKTQTVSGVITNAVKFTTTGAATVKVWWVAGDAGRQVQIYKTSDFTA